MVYGVAILVAGGGKKNPSEGRGVSGGLAKHWEVLYNDPSLIS